MKENNDVYFSTFPTRRYEPGQPKYVISNFIFPTNSILYGTSQALINACWSIKLPGKALDLGSLLKEALLHIIFRLSVNYNDCLYSTDFTGSNLSVILLASFHPYK